MTVSNLELKMSIGYRRTSAVALPRHLLYASVLNWVREHHCHYPHAWLDHLVEMVTVLYDRSIGEGSYEAETFAAEVDRLVRFYGTETRPAA